MFRIPDNADHAEQLAPCAEAATYRICAWPVVRGRSLINDDYTRRGLVVIARKVTTGDDWNSHRPEEPRGHVGTSCLVRLMQLGYIVFGIDVGAPAVEAERQPVGERGELTPGNAETRSRILCWIAFSSLDG